jgi:3-carboxy-cis,cis-muconate cycloisomerase
MAALLDLNLPDAPWHTHRDRLAEIGACFGILAGTCGKIARDVTLMMQTEVSEAFAPTSSNGGVSSTLPHKRNAAGAAAALSAATVAPNLVATLLAAQMQDNERAPGGWHTDWMTFPALALVTSGALAAIVEIAQGLEIDVERLRANLELTGGQIMAEAVAYALAGKIGLGPAHALVNELNERASRDKRSLKDALLGDTRVRSHLSVAEIDKQFIPLTYQGSAQIFIERLVVASQMRAPRRTEPRAESRPEPRVEAAPGPNPVEAMLTGAPEPKAAARPDPINPSPALASAAMLPAATARVAEASKPTDQAPALPTQPPPDKLQWPGTLLHIFTNAARQQGEPLPSDNDKPKFP